MVYCPKGLLCRDPSNFPVRPSSVCRLSVRHTQFWTRILRNMHAWNSIRVQNRVRLGHFAKPGSYEDNPNVALDHFKTWVPGRQFWSVWDILQNLTLWKTIRMFHLPIPCLFPSLSGVIQLISRIVVASAGKFERFLHNRSFGPPLPCGCNLV